MKATKKQFTTPAIKVMKMNTENSILAASAVPTGAKAAGLNYGGKLDWDNGVVLGE